MEHIAELTGVTPAEVYGTATFYEMFQFEPVGKYLINICMTMSCALLGAERVDAPRRAAPRHQGGRHDRRRRVLAAPRRVPGGLHRGALPAGQLPLPLPRHRPSSSTLSSTTSPPVPSTARSPARDARHRAPAHPRRPHRRRRRPRRRHDARLGCRPHRGGTRRDDLPLGAGVRRGCRGRPPVDRDVALPLRGLLHDRALPRHRWLRRPAPPLARPPPTSTPRSRTPPCSARRRRLPRRREVGSDTAGGVAALPRRQR